MHCQMKQNLILLSLFSLLFLSCQQNKSYINKVDPFIGTGGHGHTFPGASMPFGMVQLSPDTRINSWDGCSGYHYSDSIILGFSHTHLSGTGVGDYGDIRIMPTVGKLELTPGNAQNPDQGYCSRFSHQNENASPAYYQVYLDDYRINVELTATRRAGFHQYTFPKSNSSHIILDLTAAVVDEKIHDLQINIENNHSISGLRRSGSWAKDQYCYFVMEFSKDFNEFGLQVDGKKRKNLQQAQAKDLQAWFNFNTNSREKIWVKVGLSAVSIEGARNNLHTEIPDWDFDKTLRESQTEWQQELAKIQVDGNNIDEKIFYTSLYHSLIAPNTWSDADGKYRGHDLKIHWANHTVYSVFSLWDTFRAEHPLLSILHPKKVEEMIKSMLLMEEQGGLLPVWELAANETNCMIGYHSIPVIYDAYAKGIRGFDTEKALNAMLKSANESIFGLDSYQKYGYIKADEEAESVSRTLEYAYDDWCIAQMAKDLNKDDIYQKFIKRAQYYKNMFDPSVGFMRAKINGEWQKPFDPAEVNFHFTEGNSWQYSMFVPQDINGLIKLHGGKKAFSKKLDELFGTKTKLSGRQQSDITGLIGQYAHGNEPSHHMAYLYSYVGQAWKSQKIIAQIMNELYHDQPDGLSGNEDCGQMSAWYVLSSMGFYPVTPGSNIYVLGTPVFEKVKIALPNEKTFTITADNYSKQNIYIQSVVLNGIPHPQSFITHGDLAKGGVLQFEMGAQANKEFATKPDYCPKSEISQSLICPPPTIRTKSQTFSKQLLIRMDTPLADAQIFYTTDGSQPDKNAPLYSKEFYINKTTHFNIVSYHPEYGYSAVIESHFFKIDDSKSVDLTYAYSPLYPAGGDNALIDKIRGNNNFKTGTWQGFHDTDMEAILSFKQKTPINKISIGFIQEPGAWIFFPKKVSFYISDNKKDWILVGSEINKIDKKTSSIIHDFSVRVYPKHVKYIKIVAENSGVCPDWHLGAGGATWLFCDEILVE